MHLYVTRRYIAMVVIHWQLLSFTFFKVLKCCAIVPKICMVASCCGVVSSQSKLIKIFWTMAFAYQAVLRGSYDSSLKGVGSGTVSLWSATGKSIVSPFSQLVKYIRTTSSTSSIKYSAVAPIEAPLPPAF